MLKIAICDDNTPVASSIEKNILDLRKKYNDLFDIDVFYSGEELSKFYTANKYDMLFLDIEMDGINGIETASMIRETQDDTLIIFVSSYKSYLEKLFDVQPFNFIHKPIDWNKFNVVFDKAYKKISKTNEYFNFTFDRATFRIPVKHIIQFEKIERKIYLVTPNEKYEIIASLKEISDKLNNKNFIYATQSDLINMQHIEKIFPEYIVLSNRQKIFISRRKQKQVKDEFKKLWQEDLVNVNIL